MSEHSRAIVRAAKLGKSVQGPEGELRILGDLDLEVMPGDAVSIRGMSGSGKSTLLDRVGLTSRRHHYPTQLSGGEQQRVAIARAFATGPRVLFADEPTGNLELAPGQRIADTLHGLREETGTALVLVTHDQKLADRCERRLLLVDGRLEPLA